jgi:hypothetical protein
MKEVGLLFTVDNLRLIPPGIKTQTRRGNGLDGLEFAVTADWDDGMKAWVFCDANGYAVGKRKCPYGNPQGTPTRYYPKERVWVTHIDDNDINQITARILYSAEGIYRESREVVLTLDDYYRLVSRRDWRKPSSPMFMLRSFARTWLPGVRTWPERLGEMSEADALAEGIELDPEMMPFGYRDEFIGNPCWRDYLNGGHDLTPVQSYASLWDSINGRGAWNPEQWVWAIEFQPPATGKPV